MAEDIILDFSKRTDMAVMILRWFVSPTARLGFELLNTQKLIWINIYISVPDISMLLDLTLREDWVKLLDQNYESMVGYLGHALMQP
jgi:hypothetical protein